MHTKKQVGGGSVNNVAFTMFAILMYSKVFLYLRHICKEQIFPILFFRPVQPAGVSFLMIS